MEDMSYQLKNISTTPKNMQNVLTKCMRISRSLKKNQPYPTLISKLRRLIEIVYATLVMDTDRK